MIHEKQPVRESTPVTEGNWALLFIIGALALLMVVGGFRLMSLAPAPPPVPTPTVVPAPAPTATPNPTPTPLSSDGMAPS